MKYRIYITIICLLSSCNNFLEEDLRSQVATDDYYNNVNELEKALYGAYSKLNTLYAGTGIPAISDITGEVSTNGTGGGGGASTRVFDNFAFNTSSGDLLNIYEQNYSLINAVNLLLYKSQQNNFNTPKQAVIEGEAKFLRALAYFNLVRLFGGVPLWITPPLSLDNLNRPRNPESEIYEQIIQDLDDAVAGMNEASLVKGRANRLAALALLGKVHLTVGNYQLAIDAFNQITGKRSLYPNYIDVFKISNENNVIESLFEIQYGLRPNNNDIVQFFTPVQVTGVGFVYGVYSAENELLNAYEPADLRKDVTLWSEFGGKQFGGFYFRKFNDGLTPGVLATDAGQINFPVLRYADVLLMYAEALNELNDGPTPEAYAAVETVRLRAGLTDPLPTGLDKEAFLQVILKERLVEFAGEGHRWFDLKRTGKLSEKLASRGFIEGKHELFPIPQAARDANSALTQNNY